MLDQAWKNRQCVDKIGVLEEQVSAYKEMVPAYNKKNRILEEKVSVYMEKVVALAKEVAACKNMVPAWKKQEEPGRGRAGVGLYAEGRQRVRAGCGVSGHGPGVEDKKNLGVELQVSGYMEKFVSLAEQASVYQDMVASLKNYGAEERLVSQCMAAAMNEEIGRWKRRWRSFRSSWWPVMAKPWLQ